MKNNEYLRRKISESNWEYFEKNSEYISARKLFYFHKKYDTDSDVGVYVDGFTISLNKSNDLFK